nr:uncharacterized protein LOC129261414 [Lytechinus pictus]
MVAIGLVSTTTHPSLCQHPRQTPILSQATLHPALSQGQAPIQQATRRLQDPLRLWQSLHWRNRPRLRHQTQGTQDPPPTQRLGPICHRQTRTTGKSQHRLGQEPPNHQHPALEYQKGQEAIEIHQHNTVPQDPGPHINTIWHPILRHHPTSNQSTTNSTSNPPPTVTPPSPPTQHSSLIESPTQPATSPTHTPPTPRYNLRRRPNTPSAHQATHPIPPKPTRQVRPTNTHRTPPLMYLPRRRHTHACT